MTRDARAIAILAALALLAGGSWWLARSARTPVTVFDGKTRHDPDYVIERFNATAMLPDGNRKYTLAAAKLTHYGDDGSSELEEPYLIQYDRGTPVHTRARRGWMPRDNSHIVMTGDVRMTRGRDPKNAGAEIATDSMKIILDK